MVKLQFRVNLSKLGPAFRLYQCFMPITQIFSFLVTCLFSAGVWIYNFCRPFTSQIFNAITAQKYEFITYLALLYHSAASVWSFS